MKRRSAALALLSGLFLGRAAAGGDGLVATLTPGPAATAPGPGELVAHGTAFVSVEGRRVGMSILLTGLDGAPTAVHLHGETAGAGGPVIIPFFGPGSGQLSWTSSSSRPMEDTVPSELAADLIAHPERYSLDVHIGGSTEPAIRGTLSWSSARTPEEAGIRYLPPAPGAIGAIDLPAGPGAAAPGTAIGMPLRSGLPVAPRGAESPQGAGSAPGPGTPWPVGAPVRSLPKAPVSVEPPPSAPRSEQTITFGRLPRLVYGDPDAPLPAHASSGLPVSFTATGDCSVRGSSLHVLSAGRCLVTAHQYGNAAWSPAESEARIQIEKAGQRISMRTLMPMTYLDPDPDLEARASSGLPVVVLAYGDCETRSRGALHVTGAGTCTISAHQAGDSNFTAAPIVDGSFAIARARQSIDTSEIPGLSSRALHPLRFSATSGLPVRISTTGPCSASGSTLEPLGTGTCTVWYEQEGDRNFEPAPTVSQTFRITLPE